MACTLAMLCARPQQEGPMDFTAIERADAGNGGTTSIFSRRGDTLTWVRANSVNRTELDLRVTYMSHSWDSSSSMGEIRLEAELNGSTLGLTILGGSDGIRAELETGTGPGAQPRAFDIDEMSYQ